MQLTSLSLALTRAGFLSFSPASLFAASEQGVWYDPSDIDRYVSQLGTELVTNGDFSSGATGWTFDGGASVSGGSLSFSGVAVTQGATNVGTVSSGKFYQVTFTVVSVSVGGVSISNGTTLGISRTSAGTYTEVFSSGASAAIKVVARGTSTTAVIDNISVRELTALDTATMFQDSVGTTPVTAVEQPVGLILDKSKGLVLGPELVTNGDFSSGTNWTTASGAAGGGTAISGGVLAVTRSGGYIAAGQSIPFVAGKSYRISCLAKRTSGSGAVALVIRTLNDISSTARLTAITASTTDFAVYSAVYVCNTTENAFMQLGVGTSDGVIEFDNISVRELPGNHATQTTSTSRPVLSARYNLIESTEQFVALRWTRSNASVSVNATDAPNGNLSAAKLSATATTSTHALAQGLTVQSGVAYRFSCYLKAGEETTAALWQNVSGGTVFDLVAGTVISGLAQATIEPVGNGWFLCSVPYTPSSTSGLVQIYPRTTASYTGDGTSGVYIWGASLVPANQAALPYQRVNTSTDYDTTGFPLYLKFDGVDDFLVTNSINFTATDKMTVFAGVRDLSTALASIVELSAVTNTLSGAFVLYGRVAANGDSAFGLNTGGSFGYRQTGAPAAFPYSAVISDSLNGATGNLSTAVQPRINGATPSLTNTGSVGAGNYGNYPLYIGRRGGTTLPANMNLYSLIVRGAQSSAGQIASAETWVAGKTGITL